MDEEALGEFRQAWCLGGEAFRQECLQRMEAQVGENHPGQARFETAEAKAERIVAEELARLHWTPGDLLIQQKSHPAKLALAARFNRRSPLRPRPCPEINRPRNRFAFMLLCNTIPW